MSSAFVIRETAIKDALYSQVTIKYNTKSITVKALWDTGANISCVSEDVVSSLGLIMSGVVPRLTPSGSDFANTYLVDVILPNNVEVLNLRVCDSKIGEQGIGMLVGMDIINKGDFAVSNFDGKTVFTFRMPSESTLDFVAGIKMSNMIMAKRTASTGFSKKIKKKKR